jgi:hypothetical protein
VVTERRPSMSAGLAASTLTPGRTAPLESFTVPDMVPVPTACAAAEFGNSRHIAISNAAAKRIERM